MKTAREVMDSNHLVVGPSLTVERVVQTLLDHRTDHACVLEDDTLIGVITLVDLDEVMREMGRVASVEGGSRARLEELLGRDVRSFMTEDVVWVTPTTPLGKVASILGEKLFTLVPVVENGEVVGVVTRMSILRAMAERGMRLERRVFK